MNKQRGRYQKASKRDHPDEMASGHGEQSRETGEDWLDPWRYRGTIGLYGRNVLFLVRSIYGIYIMAFGNLYNS